MPNKDIKNWISRKQSFVRKNIILHFQPILPRWTTLLLPSSIVSLLEHPRYIFFSRVILFYLLYKECTVEVSDLFWLYRSAKVVDFLFRDKPWPISRNAIASRQKAYKWEGFLVHLSWHEMVFRVAFGMVPILLSSCVETITVVLINSNFYFMNAFTCTTHEA